MWGGVLIPRSDRASLKWESAVDLKWLHCEDRSPMCNGAIAIYVASRSEIQGMYCGVDELIGAHKMADRMNRERKR